MSIRLFLLTGITALLLAGCFHDDDDNDSAALSPSGEEYTNFVIGLFDVDPATAEPVEINDRDFAFLDLEDPTAYDELLAD